MINGKELLVVADLVSREKKISRDSVLEALEDGLATALKKDFDDNAKIEVVIDIDNGGISAFRVYDVVDEVVDPSFEVLRDIDRDDDRGFLNIAFDFDLTRQQFAITKQVALQKIKNDMREAQVTELMNKDDKLFMGSVKQYKKDGLIVDINGLDIVIPKKNLIPSEVFKVDEKIFFVFDHVEHGYHFNAYGTRVSDEFVMEVLKKEIIQIEEGDIEIVSIARVPGYKTKVALASNNGIDPIKFCIGAKGNKVKSVNGYLGNERVEFLLWDDDNIRMVINAMSPIAIEKIAVDEENHVMELCVNDGDIPFAFGKGGKNVELVSKLVGWSIKIFGETEWDSKAQELERGVVDLFVAVLDVEREVAEVIMDSDITTIEELAYLPKSEVIIDGLDDDIIAQLRQRAGDYLIQQKLIGEESLLKEFYDLGFNEKEITIIKENKIFTKDDVADLAIFDLQDIIPEMDKERASNIIMKARNLI